MSNPGAPEHGHHLGGLLLLPRQHEHVVHPSSLMARPEGAASRLSAFLASRLASVFGLAATIWLFFIAPLLVQFLPARVQAHFFFYASGWVQLFALPLLVWVGNRVQKSSDAQSEAQHQALTHIALVGDDVKTLLELNTALTKEMHERLGGTPDGHV